MSPKCLVFLFFLKEAGTSSKCIVKTVVFLGEGVVSKKLDLAADMITKYNATFYQ